MVLFIVFHSDLCYIALIEADEGKKTRTGLDELTGPSTQKGPRGKAKTMVYRLTTWLAGASLTVFAVAVTLEAVLHYTAI